MIGYNLRNATGNGVASGVNFRQLKSKALVSRFFICIDTLFRLRGYRNRPGRIIRDGESLVEGAAAYRVPVSDCVFNYPIGILRALIVILFNCTKAPLPVGILAGLSVPSRVIDSTEIQLLPFFRWSASSTLSCPTPSFHCF